MADEKRAARRARYEKEKQRWAELAALCRQQDSPQLQAATVLPNTGMPVATASCHGWAIGGLGMGLTSVPVLWPRAPAIHNTAAALPTPYHHQQSICHAGSMHLPSVVAPSGFCNDGPIGVRAEAKRSALAPTPSPAPVKAQRVTTTPSEDHNSSRRVEPGEVEKRASSQQVVVAQVVPPVQAGQ